MAFDEHKHFEDVAVSAWRIANQFNTFISWQVASGIFTGAAMMARSAQVELDAWFLQKLASVRSGAPDNVKHQGAK